MDPFKIKLGFFPVSNNKNKTNNQLFFIEGYSLGL